MDNSSMMTEPSNLAIAWEHIKLQISPFCSMASLPYDLVTLLSDHEKKILAEGLKTFLNCDVAYVLDAAHPERVFLGPPQAFHRGGLVCHVHDGELPVFVTDAVNVEAIMAAPATTVKLPIDGIVPQQSQRTRTRRPPNAYILYRKDRHEEVKAANSGISNNEISIILGKRWNEEDPTIRQEYKNRAAAIRESFMKANPNYRYCPRRPGEKKKRTRRTENKVAKPSTPVTPDNAGRWSPSQRKWGMTQLVANCEAHIPGSDELFSLEEYLDEF
ncbi:uncharacterized protein DNG_06590 [Cephalotrichum gorgonifer]|uniref:HMG box domain-containing protein n=1 Tax=Cephalotrichum gorgonifer TaxID=2041049 RepID=A0AAE8N0M0_9PEZI|nr:uncharacterized protein DNG_06590 [Cephalotrichum gorgonifer]